MTNLTFLLKNFPSTISIPVFLQNRKFLQSVQTNFNYTMDFEDSSSEKEMRRRTRGRASVFVMTSSRDKQMRRSSNSSLSSQYSVDDMIQRIKQLEDENAQLKKQVSSLYVASRREIKRKDKQISELQNSALSFD